LGRQLCFAVCESLGDKSSLGVGATREEMIPVSFRLMGKITISLYSSIRCKQIVDFDVRVAVVAVIDLATLAEQGVGFDKAFLRRFQFIIPIPGDKRHVQDMTRATKQ
jgi:hypothetical protein